ncbi:MAG: VCBS repeat-containing protein [Nitrospirae bacterium]|nr:VCBS repeat-containing protein [Nitrospirota bacterium]
MSSRTNYWMLEKLFKSNRVWTSKALNLKVFYQLLLAFLFLVSFVAVTHSATLAEDNTVVGPRSTCVESISPTSNHYYAQGTTDGVTVTPTAAGACAWTAVSNVSWIVITNGSSGRGNGTVTFTVSPNTDTTQRIGTMTIAGQTFTATQDAGGYSVTGSVNGGHGTVTCSPSQVVSGGSSTCTITPDSGYGLLSLADNGSNVINNVVNNTYTLSNITQAHTVVAMFSAQYTVASSVNGGHGSITPSISTVGSGGSVTFTMTPDTGYTIGSLTDNGADVTSQVVLNGQLNATYKVSNVTSNHTVVVTFVQSCANLQISPQTKNFPYTGGDDAVSIQGNSMCVWTASSNVSWITLTSANSGNAVNGAYVSYHVDKNTGSSSRTGTITISGLTFTVTQDAYPNCNSYTIAPTSQNFPYSGGSDTVSVTANAGCGWMASSNASWITITSGSSSVFGSGTVSYNVAANASTSPRTGTMTIAGQTFTVSQDASSGKMNLTVIINGSGTGKVVVAGGTQLTWSSDGKTGTGSFGVGTQIFLIADPGQGSTFTNWTGCDTTAFNECTVTMATDKTVNVTFNPSLTSVMKGDFNGDGKADILWRDNSTGMVYITLMNGIKVLSQGVPATVNLNWQVLGKGDFDGDGKDDILWQNTSTGDVIVWLMNATSIASNKLVASTIPSDWHVKAIGDFNGDGKADVLWQNTTSGMVAIWLMNGNLIASGGLAATGIPADWQIKAAVDFNGDGKADVLWQNTTNGSVALWFMNGASIASGSWVATGIPSDWQIKAAADFNGDGKTDILWQNISNGIVAVWLMDGANITTGGLSGTASPDWLLVSAGDFDGDGKNDILFRNTNDGTIAMWFMNGISVSSTSSNGPVGANWQIQ